MNTKTLTQTLSMFCVVVLLFSTFAFAGDVSDTPMIDFVTANNNPSQNSAPVQSSPVTNIQEVADGQ